MFDHIGIHTNDVAKLARFYEKALAPLGFEKDASGTGFGPPGAPCLWLYEGKPSAVHLAFRAKDRAVVDAFFTAGREAGGRDNGKPGVRADYSPTYYAAFLIDPDGNNVEAVVT
jgi:catechol 2,3-dioxygenase-like lactoylglutathione lyase family enzyme